MLTCPFPYSLIVPKTGDNVLFISLEVRTASVLPREACHLSS
jgi:hypothetical protein